MNEEATKDWSKEDKEWLVKHVPEGMQVVAIRHGRKVFSLVMSAGAAQFALTGLMQNVRHPQLQQFAHTTGQILDVFCKRILAAEGHTVEQFHECRQDVERVAALQDAGQRKPGDRISKGGIILDS